MLRCAVAVGLFLAVFAKDVNINEHPKDQLHKWKKFHPKDDKHPTETLELDKLDDVIDADPWRPLQRMTRQTLEKRDYYPCISCFQIGTREICTKPHCPEGHDCDKSSRRCHKKANTGSSSTSRRNKPDQSENVEEEDIQDAAPAQPAPAPAPAPTRSFNRNRNTRGSQRDTLA